MGYRKTPTPTPTATATVTPRELARLHKGKDVRFLLAGGKYGNQRSKYGNRRVEVDGIWFDSEAEAKRYGELLLLVKAGQISDLAVHTRLAFEIAGDTMFVYMPDFEYTDHTGPVPVRLYEDVKGVRTAVYKLKKRLIEAQYGITIVEIPV
jgi:hypothetical protein